MGHSRLVFGYIITHTWHILMWKKKTQQKMAKSYACRSYWLHVPIWTISNWVAFCNLALGFCCTSVQSMSSKTFSVSQLRDWTTVYRFTPIFIRVLTSEGTFATTRNDHNLPPSSSETTSTLKQSENCRWIICDFDRLIEFSLPGIIELHFDRIHQ